MPIQRNLLTGSDCQLHVLKLLSLRYGFDLVEVPDAHGGDRGIEAYSLDGCAYQCYGPEQPLKIADLYDAHMKKVSTDIKKFIDNKEELRKIFGTTIIKKWVLVVPKLSSAQLVQHCNKKAKEVLESNLPYVGKEFSVVAVTDDHFPVELKKLMEHGLSPVQLAEAAAADEKTVETWSTENSEFVRNITTKLAPLPTFDSPEHRKEFTVELLKLYLDGSNAMDELKEKYPYVHEQVMGCRARSLLK
jgi:predicted MPP superfamily phosphohydrolase